MITERFRPIDGEAEDQLYVHYNGSYSSDSIFEMPPITHNGPEASAEDFLDQRIEQELETANDPVVILDIGGGASVTAMRLGRTHHEAIADSRLAIVTTNVEVGVADYVAGLKAGRLEARELYQGGYIHEVNSDLLWHDAGYITLPDGTRHNLQNGTTVVHERFSLTAWTTDPRAQLRRLGRLLTPRSIYMVPTADIRHRKRYYKPEHYEDLETAHSMLCSNHNLQVSNLVDEGPFAGRALSYTIFSGPEALPINVQALQPKSEARAA